MKYDQHKNLKEENSRRLTGVMKTTFARMIRILKEAEIKQKARGGNIIN